jgi:hypothetical protein
MPSADDATERAEEKLVIIDHVAPELVEVTTCWSITATSFVPSDEEATENPGNGVVLLMYTVNQLAPEFVDISILAPFCIRINSKFATSLVPSADEATEVHIEPGSWPPMRAVQVVPELVEVYSNVPVATPPIATSLVPSAEDATLAKPVGRLVAGDQWEPESPDV